MTAGAPLVYRYYWEEKTRKVQWTFPTEEQADASKAAPALQSIERGHKERAAYGERKAAPSALPAAAPATEAPIWGQSVDPSGQMSGPLSPNVSVRKSTRRSFKVRATWAAPGGRLLR